METATKKIHGLALIKFLLGMFRIGFFLLAFMLIIWGITSIFIFFTDIPSFSANFPVMFSPIDEGIFKVPSESEVGKFMMKDAMGFVSSDSIPKGFLALYSLVILSMNICILLSMRQVIRILESAKMGGFLVAENAVRLRWIALLGLIILFLDRFATVTSASYFSDKLEITGLEFTWFNFFTLMEFDTLFASLFLLVIAEAFRVGALLKQENDLTI